MILFWLLFTQYQALMFSGATHTISSLEEAIIHDEQCSMTCKFPIYEHFLNENNWQCKINQSNMDTDITCTNTNITKDRKEIWQIKTLLPSKYNVKYVKIRCADKFCSRRWQHDLRYSFQISYSIRDDPVPFMMNRCIMDLKIISHHATIFLSPYYPL